MKNKTFKALVIVIVVQFVAFIGMAGYSIKSYDDVMNSMEYKMAIEPFNFYDGKLRFTTLTDDDYEYVESSNNGYITINFEENGLAFFDEQVADKPDGNFYVKSNKKNKKNFREYKIENAEDIYSFYFRNVEYDEAYIVFKANRGEVVVTGVYIDGISAEEWLRSYAPMSLEENDYDVNVNDDIILDDDLLL